MYYCYSVLPITAASTNTGLSPLATTLPAMPVVLSSANKLPSLEPAVNGNVESTLPASDQTASCERQDESTEKKKSKRSKEERAERRKKRKKKRNKVQDVGNDDGIGVDQPVDNQPEQGFERT